MATERGQELLSDLPYHPGEFAAEETAARGWTPRDLAERMGVPDDHVLDLLETRVPVTEDIAARLETAFGISAAAWLRLQRNYEATVARNAGRAIA